MADPLSWLKLGPRSRTPSTSLPTSLPDYKTTREPQPGDARRPGSSRMSSRITQAEACRESWPTDDVDNHAASIFVRDQDRIWYNPSLDQMVEALQVSLMTHGVLEPIPIEYNSYILHLIEGFAKAQAKIRKTEGAYQELKQTLEQSLEQSRRAADDWLERESQYRTEMKRLEVLLSRSSRDGLEAVALARTNSVINRGGAKRRGFLSTLNELRSDYLDGSAQPPGPTTPRILDNDNDFFISQKFRKQDINAKNNTTVFRETRADLHDTVKNKLAATVANAPELGPGEKLPSWGTEALEPDLNGTGAGQCDIRNSLAAFTNRIYHGSSKVQSPTHTRAGDEVLVGIPDPGTHHRHETFLNIPTATEPNVALTAGAASRHERHNSGFSFEPGDDCVRLLGNPAEKCREFNTSSSEQSQLSPPHLSPEGVATEKRRRRSNVNSWVNGLVFGKERRPSRENDNPTIHRPLGEPATVAQDPAHKQVRRTHGSGDSKKTTIKGSPSQSSCNSPAPATNGGQETPQRQQAETDARIAATLALANVLSSVNLKR